MATEAPMSVDGEEAVPLPERFQQLRHRLHGHWGTSAEADLLEAMQELHTCLVARSAQTHRRVEELSQRATAAQVSLANTLNSLKLLSQQQFVQHRIATEDLQLRQRAAAESDSEEADDGSSDGTASANQDLAPGLPAYATREAAVRRRMHTYVKKCMESLAEEGVRVPFCPYDVAELAAESPYSHRRLCGLIGTPAFLYDVDIGCRRGEDGLNGAAVKQHQSPPSQPVCPPAAAPPAAVIGLPSAPAKPLSLPSAAATTFVTSPHATAASASAAPTAKAVPAKDAAVSKKERRRALFSSSSSSASSSASPSAAPAPSPPPLGKRRAAVPARPLKSAPVKKGVRNLFGSSSSTVSSSSSSSSIVSGRAEAADRPVDSPTSSYLSSGDDSRPPPAAVYKSSNSSTPPRAASTSLHSSRVSSASSDALTSPPSKLTPTFSAAATPALSSVPPPPSSLAAAPEAFAPPLPPPPPPAAATASAALPLPPPPVFLFDTVSAIGAPASPPPAAAAPLPTLPLDAPPSRTGAVAAAAPSLPRRGGKVLSTSSDDDTEG
ncbi:conserved hypothetical protein [Leishmania braziliensis MHOM/BR/75/M2904]|uniref:Uncharacterized protein n=1 Tax=Leishmania braziliensis TaxID=5660 RepID=A4HG23_LEIBR|nr:conserved hypothetical protein [Leishmania braziliensis MHOM/BR/75/M2904]KAI5684788.1 hypothetical protein MNV84_05107 [Leishmania braziliensis]CAJ2475506.1 unnamed protein product [Leishmania braziliensis]CAJ2476006.1 unnamed protein product [Leishmania braziliensis]CAM45541.1 conserved hypothetical protein [Leishmania braziliensis MHOM/BR/75/M2904]